MDVHRPLARRALRALHNGMAPLHIRIIANGATNTARVEVGMFLSESDCEMGQGTVQREENGEQELSVIIGRE